MSYGLELMIIANSCKADVVKDYIGWAVGRNYGVIDVNIPKYVTSEPVSPQLAFAVHQSAKKSCS